ncbi:MAG: hypothetical protein JWQ90_5545 [Hydrocarboniphaga sp.]|uniref:hypothetical protein n=1 Tax=Hydrocarboniphaga sp. TaxID=2033016 RepID=UPI002622F049|nr:hypothetical protein [Hydrocarboniphaga sp.]MDB5973095.1 hypothetical protein [Hydrocarboniphaga sp.]
MPTITIAQPRLIRPNLSLRRRVASIGIVVPLLASSLLGSAAAAGAVPPKAKIGLGKILTTQDGGQIFGFDINQNGDDGVLASGGSDDDGTPAPVETFDQNTGEITSSVALTLEDGDSYAVDGIVAGDVGLVTHYVEMPGETGALRFYDVMNPVSAQAVSGAWTPPIDDIDVQAVGVNQTTSTSVLFVIELQNADKPDLIVSDIAANTFSKLIHLNPALFGLNKSPHMAQYTSANQAVFALSPDGGAVGGSAPLNVLIDLASGATTKFKGYNNGPYGAGYINGLAVDPNTGIAATTTELNAQVEFYNLKKKKGIAAVQLPCTGNSSQLQSGSNIAVDPINKLFMVTETNYCGGSQGSAIVVYDEKGHLVETITGFHFAIGEPAPVINPGKRMGWAFGGPQGFNQLQQFFY